MKKLLFCFVLSILGVLAQGQIDSNTFNFTKKDYLKVLELNHIWNLYDTPSSGPGEFYFRYRVGETPKMINGQLYRPILQSSDSIGNNWIQKYNKTWMREENGKLWALNEADTTYELLIMNMDLSFGDTIVMNRDFSEIILKVYKEDSITDMMGTVRKRLALYCTNMDENYAIQWIEGIGSTRALFELDIYTCFPDGGASSLLCFSNDGEYVWETNDFNVMNGGKVICWKVSTSNIETAWETLKVYPNPSNYYFIVEHNENTSLSYEITNIHGQIIDQGYFEANVKHQINTENLNSGLYIIKFLDSIGHSHMIKWIKN